MSQAWGWSNNGGSSVELNAQAPRTEQPATTYVVPYNAGSTYAAPSPSQQAYYYNTSNLATTTTTKTTANQPVTVFHKCVIAWLVILSVGMVIGFIMAIILFTF